MAELTHLASRASNEKYHAPLARQLQAIESASRVTHKDLQMQLSSIENRVKRHDAFLAEHGQLRTSMVAGEAQQMHVSSIEDRVRHHDVVLAHHDSILADYSEGRVSTNGMELRLSSELVNLREQLSNEIQTRAKNYKRLEDMLDCERMTRMQDAAIHSYARAQPKAHDRSGNEGHV